MGCLTYIMGLFTRHQLYFWQCLGIIEEWCQDFATVSYIVWHGLHLIRILAFRFRNSLVSRLAYLCSARRTLYRWRSVRLIPMWHRTPFWISLALKVLISSSRCLIPRGPDSLIEAVIRLVHPLLWPSLLCSLVKLRKSFQVLRNSKSIYRALIGMLYPTILRDGKLIIKAPLNTWDHNGSKFVSLFTQDSTPKVSSNRASKICPDKT